MEYLRIATWIAAIFFVGSWSLGLMSDPSQRIKSTVVTVGYWWALLSLPLLGLFSVLHLLWLFPLALFIPGVIQGGYLRRTMQHPTIWYVAVGSALPILGPAIAISSF